MEMITPIYNQAKTKQLWKSGAHTSSIKNAKYEEFAGKLYRQYKAGNQ